MRFLVSFNGILLSSLGNIIYYSPRNIWTLKLLTAPTWSWLLTVTFSFTFLLQDCTIIPAVLQSSQISPLDLSLYKIYNWFIHLFQQFFSPHTLILLICPHTKFITGLPIFFKVFPVLFSPFGFCFHNCCHIFQHSFLSGDLFSYVLQSSACTLLRW